MSHSTIQNFKSRHLNLKGKMLEDIKEHTAGVRAWAKRKQEEEEVQSTSAYQQAITQIAEEELDVRKELLKVFTIIESRIENHFDKLNEGDFTNKDSEKFLQTYLDQFMKVLEQHKKYVEGFKETTEHNINITVMNDQVTIIREAIRETLIECDSSMAVMFMDKLNGKMRELAYENEANSYLLNSALGVKDEY